MVIPAHPLALTPDHKLDERRQRALSRYYLAAGAGGLAVGVHTTQFAIRDQPACSSRCCASHARKCAIAGNGGDRRHLRRNRAGVERGRDRPRTRLRRRTAEPGRAARGERRRVDRPRAAGRGGDSAVRLLPPAERRRPRAAVRVLAAASPRSRNVVAIKIAPFNRYQTLDVVRAVVESGRAEDIALYTGNDDNIVVDLLTRVRLRRAQGRASPADCSGTGRCGPRGRSSTRVRRACERTAGANLLTLAAAGHRLQRSVLRRRARFRRLHRRHPRSAAAAGPARRTLVPRPPRGAVTRTGGGDRPCLRAYPHLNDDESCERTWLTGSRLSGLADQ